MNEEYDPDEINPATLSLMMQNRKSDEFSMWRLDIRDITESLTNILKGGVIETQINENGEEEHQWVYRDEYRMLTDSGIFAVKFMLEGMVNKNTMLSNLSDEMILSLIRTFSKELCINFFRNYKKYGLNKKNFRFNMEFIENFVYFCLQRAANAGEREEIGKMRSEHSVTRPEQKNEEKFSLNPFKREG